MGVSAPWVRRVSVTAPGDTTLVQLVAALLREHLPGVPVSNADARRTVVAGAVHVNGRRTRAPGAAIAAGDRVTVAAAMSRLARARRSPHAPVRLLYSDEHVVVVEKPAGLPTHATADPHRPHLVAAVAHHLGVAEASLGVHQRLDAGTSGVVLLARSPAANRGLARLFADGGVEKIYLAIVDASRRRDLAPGDAWIAAGALAASGAGRRGRRMAVSGEGRVAHTAFLVRWRTGDRSGVEARPTTGRQHQIRAHLADAGTPIVGDSRYGGPPADRLHLHAWKVRLPHPVSGVRLEIEAPVPQGWMRDS